MTPQEEQREAGWPPPGTSLVVDQLLPALDAGDELDLRAASAIRSLFDAHAALLARVEALTAERDEMAGMVKTYQKDIADLSAIVFRPEKELGRLRASLAAAQEERDEARRQVKASMQIRKEENAQSARELEGCRAALAASDRALLNLARCAVMNAAHLDHDADCEHCADRLLKDILGEDFPAIASARARAQEAGRG